MKTVIKYVVLLLLVLPSSVITATNCRVTEYPDHYEAVCIGDEQPGSPQKQTAVQTPPVSVKTPDWAQTVEAANPPDAQQADTMIQEFIMVTKNMPGKTTITIPKDNVSSPLAQSRDDVSATSVQSKGDASSPPVKAQRTARTTAMESAIAARRKLIQDLQSQNVF